MRPSKLAKRGGDEADGGSGGGGGGATLLPFAEAVQAAEQYEVCRMFLAALQLTNSGNVRLHHEGDLDAGTQQLHVELVSADSAFDFSTL